MRFALFALTLTASAADFRAGVARVDITPPVGHEMGGYSARKGTATGTHDPLFATVIVLESGTQTLAIVTADLRSFVSTRVGELAKQRYGIATTIISVSHTHSGPLTWELRSPWYSEAENKMVDAIGKAVGVNKAAMFPATLEFASGNVTLGFNRRKIVDGHAAMWWRNEEKLPSHPVDSTLSALLIKDDSSKTRAVLVNYACHPSVLGPDNLQYSADYPGAMKRYIETQIPGALAAFVQGGAGDINPYRDKEPVAHGFDVVSEMGDQLGKAVVAMLPKAKPVTGAMRTASEIVDVKNRFKPSEKISIGTTVGVIGDGKFCFASFPGEPFIEHQMTFREKSECSASMMFGYSYSAGGTWAGYIPTILAAVEGGYGADYNTTVEVGTGEMLVDRAVVKLHTLRGLLRQLPEAH